MFVHFSSPMSTLSLIGGISVIKLEELDSLMA